MTDLDDEPTTFDEAAERIHRAFCDPDHELVSQWDADMAAALKRNGYRIMTERELDALIEAERQRVTGLFLTVPEGATAYRKVVLSILDRDLPHDAGW